MTLRSEGGEQELPRRTGHADRLVGLASGMERTDFSPATAVATRPDTKSRVKQRPSRPLPDEGQSPIAVVIVAGFALVAALVVWLITGGPQVPEAQQPDPHPLPTPLALEAEAPLVTGLAPSPGLREPIVDRSPPPAPVEFRVRLIEQPAGDGQAVPSGAVALETVESPTGITAAGEGSAMLLLAVRNVTDQAVRDPRFVVNLVEESGAVLRSWRGTVEATLEPGELLEVEALPPYGMEHTVGRLELRAFGSPPAVTP